MSSKPERHATEYIYTYSGQVIYPEEIRPEQINLVDIAYGLAGIYRFNGHTRVSVLRHSLAVYRECMHRETLLVRSQLFILLHDAAEAYVMDIPVPMKRFMNSGWQQTNQDIQKMIYGKFNAEGTPFSEALLNDVDKTIVEYEMSCALSDSPFKSAMSYPCPKALTKEDMRRLRDFYSWDYKDDELIPRFMDLVDDLTRPVA